MGGFMHITDIRCYVVPHIAEQPRFRWRTGLPGDGDGTLPGEKSYYGVLRVDTDEGYTGCAYGRGPRLADIVQRRLKKAFIGADPLLTEDLWHKMWELDRIEEFQVYDLGVIDIACWDIKSQAAKMPIYKMLGGNNVKVPAYASTVTWETMGEYEQHIKECIDEGFFAFKLHAWGDPKADAELSKNLRKWCGPDAELMFDGSAGWDYVTSLRFGRILEDLNFFWLEEPMREFDLTSYSELCHALDIPILGAETPDGAHWNASTWIQMRALDMMRTEVGFKGGLTGGIKVAHLAESFGMRCEVHGMGWGNAQLCAAVPNNDYYEQLVIDTQQIKELKDIGPLSIVDGYLTVPDEPGMGPQPDWTALERQAVMIV
jgi:L-alanine-DL-glutamate epimerase-like enolase superfamily enzyme